MDLGIAIVLIMILLAAFAVIFILGIGGFDFGDFFRWFFMIDRSKDEIKKDVKEVEIESPIKRKQQREFLLGYCRDAIQYSGNEVERKLNAICLQILENNPEVCTIEELMTELDKRDKNLYNNLFKEN